MSAPTGRVPANPRRATAQSLTCAIQAKEKLQYLICCVNSNGDPISNNCPGTYDDVAEGGQAIHPQDMTMAETSLTWGDKTYKAAAPWGKLTDASRARAAFIHHVTLGNNHGDQPKVMRLMGWREEHLCSERLPMPVPGLGD